jgi:hypothetical protein
VRPTVASAYWLGVRALRSLYCEALGRLWQDRVRRILLEYAHDDAVFSIQTDETNTAR